MHGTILPGANELSSSDAGCLIQNHPYLVCSTQPGLVPDANGLPRRRVAPQLPRGIGGVADCKSD